ncbi:hypothetical protein JCM19232_6209 [Vibrio ishigakensis]|uniref:Uncharacterized protein n=1 Tax=Vibrio ishigakensis TaxID=1481914 RepID=A0A0B8PGL9_9VIBR|nr:hypothetical protein [Vibrio ishigakensis]GAM55786.1 hypothetical protein JCM19231_2388 [Vibrio ishigakensis]GAM61904.1 hypothetical protein JCM19232_6209 [Vibrio ishigakensis]GAM69205.1 hypothetical protein JCM19236_5518 [Vibrio sp. JCM 19236]GAM72965.1 hypothetical protein JCM19241_2420 [Vibrio ishigakensis]
MKHRRKLSKKLAQKTVSANRRKRMLSNNKKKVLGRNRAYSAVA